MAISPSTPSQRQHAPVTFNGYYKERENQENQFNELYKVAEEKRHEPKNNKRGPTTPLGPSRHQNVIRRKVAHDELHEKDADPFIDVSYAKARAKIDLVEAKYQNWLLSEFLCRQKELVKFMELERKYTKELSARR